MEKFEQIDSKICIRMELYELPMISISRGYLDKKWYQWFVENGGKIVNLAILKFPDENTKLMFLLKFPNRDQEEK